MNENSAGRLFYTPNLNPRVAVAVARHVEAPVTFVRADPMGAERELFRPINPNTLAPILVEDGRPPLWETDAIALRLSLQYRPDFWPAEHQVDVMRWVSWSAHHFTLAGGTFYFENIIVPQFMGREPDEVLLASAEQDFIRFAEVLDDVLAERRWLINGQPTYADFRVASALPFADRAHLPLADFSNIRRWHDRLNEFDAWREPFAGLEAGS